MYGNCEAQCGKSASALDAGMIAADPRFPLLYVTVCTNTVLTTFAAEAIDQWFENLHHYEVTLVRANLSWP